MDINDRNDEGPIEPEMDLWEGMDVVENPPEKKTSFMYAELNGADFSGCDLSDCDFTYAKLAGANFQNAILANTVFRYADLQNASFVGAKFKVNDMEFVFGKDNSIMRPPPFRVIDDSQRLNSFTGSIVEPRFDESQAIKFDEFKFPKSSTKRKQK